MLINRIVNEIIGRDDYQERMDLLAEEETKHAPRFSVEEAPEEIRTFLKEAEKPRCAERSKWLNDYAAMTWQAPDGEAEILFAEDHMNSVRYLNRYLRKANEKLKMDGYFICAFDTSGKRKIKIFSKYPKIIAYPVFYVDFFWNRMCPKLYLTRWFYYSCTKGVRKVFPRPEVLGRLYYTGFDVVSERYIHDRFCIIAQKKRQPSPNRHVYGLLVKLRRVGKGGELFNVFKFRTMFAYSEYLQSYVYENNELDEGGKFKDDYRITEWGKLLRKYWLDELPMIINILKGQMKLVGVRPLSKQYYDLYTPEIQQLRIKTKPGLLPPYYVDMPKTLAEIQESERRYLEAYLKHPFRTDWKYFWAIVRNIVIKKKRSK